MISENSVRLGVENHSKSIEEAFVGKNYTKYYKRKWNEMDEKKRQTSWNFAAFFLSLFWLGYRKMYRYIFIIMGLFLAVDLLIFLAASGDEAMVMRLNNSVGMGLAVATGLFGNYMYRLHMNKQIELTAASTTDPEKQKAMLRKKGGRSWIGVVNTVLIFIGYLIVTTVLFG
ncbi:DUF2628 domain-containing protein [Alkalihalophilus marmarensis]|uniref:DUF2628 domain-containing protein n=1 Tax=Alkalihalophilus marmarensis TaxID=521377 RepID=UPI002DBDEA80|nr:DUF2628 domain-containing protein [Alkalihalophilus marmarensis]MEC2073395.1 DUF2628 domain-containing protein [Alkalihalophilus marmarensis]